MKQIFIILIFLITLFVNSHSLVSKQQQCTLDDMPSKIYSSPSSNLPLDNSSIFFKLVHQLSPAQMYKLLKLDQLLYSKPTKQAIKIEDETLRNRRSKLISFFFFPFRLVKRIITNLISLLWIIVNSIKPILSIIIDRFTSLFVYFAKIIRFLLWRLPWRFTRYIYFEYGQVIGLFFTILIIGGFSGAIFTCFHVAVSWIVNSLGTLIHNTNKTETET